MFVFTDHAIERYIQRHARHLSFDAAKEMLESHASEAVRLKMRTFAGHTQWKFGDAIVVTKRDSDSTDDVVVTVLPARANVTVSGVPREELVQALEYIEQYGFEALTPDICPQQKKEKPLSPDAGREDVALEKFILQEREKTIRILAEYERGVLLAKERATMAAAKLESNRINLECAKEKTRRHNERREADIERLRHTLRAALLAVASGASKEEVFMTVELLSPSFTSDDFLYPKSKTGGRSP